MDIISFIQTHQGTLSPPNMASLAAASPGENATSVAIHYIHNYCCYIFATHKALSGLQVLDLENNAYADWTGLKPDILATDGKQFWIYDIKTKKYAVSTLEHDSTVSKYRAAFDSCPGFQSVEIISFVKSNEFDDFVSQLDMYPTGLKHGDIKHFYDLAMAAPLDQDDADVNMLEMLLPPIDDDIFMESWNTTFSSLMAVMDDIMSELPKCKAKAAEYVNAYATMNRKHMAYNAPKTDCAEAVSMFTAEVGAEQLQRHNPLLLPFLPSDCTVDELFGCKPKRMFKHSVTEQGTSMDITTSGWPTVVAELIARYDTTGAHKYIDSDFQPHAHRITMIPPKDAAAPSLEEPIEPFFSAAATAELERLGYMSKAFEHKDRSIPGGLDDSCAYEAFKTWMEGFSSNELKTFLHKNKVCTELEKLLDEYGPKATSNIWLHNLFIWKQLMRTHQSAASRAKTISLNSWANTACWVCRRSSHSTDFVASACLLPQAIAYELVSHLLQARMYKYLFSIEYEIGGQRHVLVLTLPVKFPEAAIMCMTRQLAVGLLLVAETQRHTLVTAELCHLCWIAGNAHTDTAEMMGSVTTLVKMCLSNRTDITGHMREKILAVKDTIYSAPLNWLLAKAVAALPATQAAFDRFTARKQWILDESVFDAETEVLMLPLWTKPTHSVPFSIAYESLKAVIKVIRMSRSHENLLVNFIDEYDELSKKQETMTSESANFSVTGEHQSCDLRNVLTITNTVLINTDGTSSIHVDVAFAHVLDPMFNWCAHHPAIQLIAAADSIESVPHDFYKYALNAAVVESHIFDNVMSRMNGSACMTAKGTAITNIELLARYVTEFSDHSIFQFLEEKDLWGQTEQLAYFFAKPEQGKAQRPIEVMTAERMYFQQLVNGFARHVGRTEAVTKFTVDNPWLYQQLSWKTFGELLATKMYAKAEIIQAAIDCKKYSPMMTVLQPLKFIGPVYMLYKTGYPKVAKAILRHSLVSTRMRILATQFPMQTKNKGLIEWLCQQQVRGRVTFKQYGQDLGMDEVSSRLGKSVITELSTVSDYMLKEDIYLEESDNAKAFNLSDERVNACKWLLSEHKMLHGKPMGFDQPENTYGQEISFRFILKCLLHVEEDADKYNPLAYIKNLEQSACSPIMGKGTAAELLCYSDDLKLLIVSNGKAAQANQYSLLERFLASFPLVGMMTNRAKVLSSNIVTEMIGVISVRLGLHLDMSSQAMSMCTQYVLMNSIFDSQLTISGTIRSALMNGLPVTAVLLIHKAYSRCIEDDMYYRYCNTVRGKFGVPSASCRRSYGNRINTALRSLKNGHVLRDIIMSSRLTFNHILPHSMNQRMLLLQNTEDDDEVKAIFAIYSLINSFLSATDSSAPSWKSPVQAGGITFDKLEYGAVRNKRLTKLLKHAQAIVAQRFQADEETSYLLEVYRSMDQRLKSLLLEMPIAWKPGHLETWFLLEKARAGKLDFTAVDAVERMGKTMIGWGKCIHKLPKDPELIERVKTLALRALDTLKDVGTMHNVEYILKTCRDGTSYFLIDDVTMLYLVDDEMSKVTPADVLACKRSVNIISNQHAITPQMIQAAINTSRQDMHLEAHTGLFTIRKPNIQSAWSNIPAIDLFLTMVMNLPAEEKKGCLKLMSRLGVRGSRHFQETMDKVKMVSSSDVTNNIILDLILSLKKKPIASYALPQCIKSRETNPVYWFFVNWSPMLSLIPEQIPDATWIIRRLELYEKSLEQLTLVLSSLARLKLSDAKNCRQFYSKAVAKRKLLQQRYEAEKAKAAQQGQPFQKKFIDPADIVHWVEDELLLAIKTQNLLYARLLNTIFLGKTVKLQNSSTYAMYSNQQKPVRSSVHLQDRVTNVVCDKGTWLYNLRGHIVTVTLSDTLMVTIQSPGAVGTGIVSGLDELLRKEGFLRWIANQQMFVTIVDKLGEDTADKVFIKTANGVCICFNSMKGRGQFAWMGSQLVWADYRWKSTITCIRCIEGPMDEVADAAEWFVFNEVRNSIEVHTETKGLAPIIEDVYLTPRYKLKGLPLFIEGLPHQLTFLVRDQNSWTVKICRNKVGIAWNRHKWPRMHRIIVDLQSSRPLGIAAQEIENRLVIAAEHTNIQQLPSRDPTLDVCTAFVEAACCLLSCHLGDADAPVEFEEGQVSYISKRHLRSQLNKGKRADKLARGLQCCLSLDSTLDTLTVEDLLSAWSKIAPKYCSITWSGKVDTGLAGLGFIQCRFFFMLKVSSTFRSTYTPIIKEVNTAINTDVYHLGNATIWLQRTVLCAERAISWHSRHAGHNLKLIAQAAKNALLSKNLPLSVHGIDDWTDLLVYAMYIMNKDMHTATDYGNAAMTVHDIARKCLMHHPKYAEDDTTADADDGLLDASEVATDTDYNWADEDQYDDEPDDSPDSATPLDIQLSTLDPEADTFIPRPKITSASVAVENPWKAYVMSKMDFVSKEIYREISQWKIMRNPPCGSAIIDGVPFSMYEHTKFPKPQNQPDEDSDNDEPQTAVEAVLLSDFELIMHSCTSVMCGGVRRMKCWRCSPDWYPTLVGKNVVLSYAGAARLFEYLKDGGYSNVACQNILQLTPVAFNIGGLDWNRRLFQWPQLARAEELIEYFGKLRDVQVLATVANIPLTTITVKILTKSVTENRLQLRSEDLPASWSPQYQTLWLSIKQAVVHESEAELLSLLLRDGRNLCFLAWYTIKYPASVKAMEAVFHPVAFTMIEELLHGDLKAIQLAAQKLHQDFAITSACVDNLHSHMPSVVMVKALLQPSTLRHTSDYDAGVTAGRINFVEGAVLIPDRWKNRLLKMPQMSRQALLSLSSDIAPASLDEERAIEPEQFGQLQELLEETAQVLWLAREAYSKGQLPEKHALLRALALPMAGTSVKYVKSVPKTASVERLYAYLNSQCPEDIVVNKVLFSAAFRKDWAEWESILAIEIENLSKCQTNYFMHITSTKDDMFDE